MKKAKVTPNKKGSPLSIKVTKLGFGTVIWEDASNNVNESLTSITKKEKDLVQTFGYIYKDRNYFYIMTHYAGDENNDFMKVPKGMVIEFKVIEDLDEEDFFLKLDNTC